MMFDLYSEGGVNFIWRSCYIDGPSYLKKILGLTLFQEEANANLAEIGYCFGLDDKYGGF